MQPEHIEGAAPEAECKGRVRGIAAHGRIPAVLVQLVQKLELRPQTRFESALVHAGGSSERCDERGKVPRGRLPIKREATQVAGQPGGAAARSKLLVEAELVGAPRNR